MALQELPKDRLATTDESGKRVYLYPALVRGRFKNRKAFVHAALILFFLLLPWIRIGGHQALLLDVANRGFSIFGLFLRGHDAPLLFFLLLGFALSIAFVTALWGRIWCGWACPQTVFIEGVFRRIEAFVEGGPHARKELDEGPWNFRKSWKKAVKWALFLGVSLVVTNSFLAYFVGSHEVLHMMMRPPQENWTSFLVVLFTTGIILFDFGWFREQFCVIMCPYGRFQSVLLDDDSIVVGYDTKRGEPRRGSVPAGATQGDCVNCFRCVHVCPTGIDIRRGVQMECIACTACIDACDEVMTKIHKPRGLIRYASLSSLHGGRTKWLRPRTYAYLTLLTVGVVVFLALLGQQESLEVSFLRAKDAPYQTLPQGDGGTLVVNHFIADFSNQNDRETAADLVLSAEDRAKGIEVVLPIHPLQLKEHEQRRADFFLRFPLKAIQNGSGKVKISVQSGQTITKTEELTIVGPNQ